MNTVFDEEAGILASSLKSIDENEFWRLVNDAQEVLTQGGKIIVSGLGKNVPIGEKFVGTMVSLGLAAAFMHTNSAIHGDLGIVGDRDLVILLTKSGETAESVHLFNQLRKRSSRIWLLTFNADSSLGKLISDKLTIRLAHEGDLWNIVPNNSSILNLIVLQKLTMELARRLGVKRESFMRNHPGGHIGSQA